MVLFREIYLLVVSKGKVYSVDLLVGCGQGKGVLGRTLWLFVWEGFV